MLRHALVIVALWLTAAAANAATLTVTADKASYDVGETITLSIVGDSQGAAAYNATGFLLFDTSLAFRTSGTQVPLTSFGGTVTWVVGGVSKNCTAQVQYHGCLPFDQINGIPSAPSPVDNLLQATMTLTALAPGVVDFTWETRNSTGLELSFFGLTNAPGTSILIQSPEPGTAALLAFGLAALARASRTRHVA